MPRSGSEEKFVRDFVKAWTKVMNADRFDLPQPSGRRGHSREPEMAKLNVLHERNAGLAARPLKRVLMLGR